MANMLGHADKRTEQQRHDDAITGRDDLTPTALNNEGNMVGTGPNTKKEDTRAVGTTPAPKNPDKKKGHSPVASCALSSLNALCP